MDRDALLRTIAETGYNVGFGAKKTFATYDIVEKGPGWIGFISFVVGLFGLIYEALAAKVPSAILLIAGVAALYISLYRSRDYEDAGIKQTQLLNALRDLYRSVKAGADIAGAKTQLRDIETQYYGITISKQIFLSDWYAHYKFFAQLQTDWMDEQLHFHWWRDKIPLSAKAVLIVFIAGTAGVAIWLAIRATAGA
jgi:hypothetical protein